MLLCGLPAGRCTGFSVIRGLFGSGSSWLVCLRFYVSVNINVNNLLAISKLDFDNSGEPGPQAKGVNHLETHSDNCTQLTGPPPVLSEVVTCNCVRNPGGASGIEPETCRRRGQLLSRPPTTGPTLCVHLQWFLVVCGNAWPQDTCCCLSVTRKHSGDLYMVLY